MASISESEVKMERGEAVLVNDLGVVEVAVVMLLEQRHELRAPYPVQSGGRLRGLIHQVRRPDPEVAVLLVDRGVEGSLASLSRRSSGTLSFQPVSEHVPDRRLVGVHFENANRRRIAVSTSAMDRSALFIVAR